MSKQTPRKAKHARYPSNKVPAISDYESDAAAIQPSYSPPPLRTNTELNLTVLQRYVPSIHTILSIAPSVQVYYFGQGEWLKTSHEGTLFICAQAPLLTDPEQRPRACVFVLNRKVLDNVVIDLARVSMLEGEGGEFMILKVDPRGGVGEESVIGLWTHNDKKGTRQRNWTMINECWRFARPLGAVEGEESDVGPATLAIGRRLSVSDLGSKHGGLTAIA